MNTFEEAHRHAPLVTVVMNCFNGEKYLREALDSVFAQTYPSLEVIFWDNQSSDGSAEIAKSYRDPRLRYYYAPQHTVLAAARNSALGLARGEFVAFLDVDDRWHTDKLDQQIPLFSDSEVGMVCGNYWVDSEIKKKRWKRFKVRAPAGWVLDELLAEYYVGLSTLVVRQSALASLTYPCDPRYNHIEDFDLVVRLSVGWKLACVQEPVASYRLHGGSETARDIDRPCDEMALWLDEMRIVEAIRRSPRFSDVEEQLVYARGINHVLRSERSAALSHFRKLRSPYLKSRLLLSIALPSSIARRLKN